MNQNKQLIDIFTHIRGELINYRNNVVNPHMGFGFCSILSKSPYPSKIKTKAWKILKKYKPVEFHSSGYWLPLTEFGFTMRILIIDRILIQLRQPLYERMRQRFIDWLNDAY